MKLLILFVILILAVSWEKNGTSFTIDTLMHRVVNPDMYDLVNQTNGDVDTSYRFMVIGDFGNILNLYNLRKVGTMMNDMVTNKEEIAEQRGTKNVQTSYSHIMTVGDNFYMNGIRYIWFRLIPWLVMSSFKKSALKDVPFYPTLGNHDWYGGMYNEIAYSKYDDQWNMTEDYYVLKHQLKDGSGKYFANLMLNTCKLFCPVKGESTDEEWGRYGIEPGGYEVKKHYDWIENQLQILTSDPSIAWIAVSLHHPVFTNVVLKNHLLPILRKYKVDMIFNGHEHWAEYSNMEFDYQLRYPQNSYGNVLINCTYEEELLLKPGREQTFKKGDHIHKFLTGNGGTFLRNYWPHKDQDGDVYIRNIQNYGVLDIDVTENKFTATYVELPYREIYKVNIIR